MRLMQREKNKDVGSVSNVCQESITRVSFQMKESDNLHLDRITEIRINETET